MNVKMLAGKTVLITGCNRGLGSVLMREFAKCGANVIAHVRKESDDFSERCSDLASETGTTIRSIAFDLADSAGIERTMEEFFRTKVKVDALINSAGIGRWGYFQMMPMETVRETLEVNLLGPMTLSQLLYRYMATKGGGSIVNIASIAALDLSAGNCAYGVSKAALIAFTKSLAAESGMFKVRVNAIAPGYMETDMGVGMGVKEKELALARSSIKRICTPEDVANASIFLVSEQAAYINGQVLSVDGGHK